MINSSASISLMMERIAVCDAGKLLTFSVAANFLVKMRFAITQLSHIANQTHKPTMPSTNIPPISCYLSVKIIVRYDCILFVHILTVCIFVHTIVGWKLNLTQKRLQAI